MNRRIYPYTFKGVKMSTLREQLRTLLAEIMTDYSQRDLSAADFPDVKPLTEASFDELDMREFIFKVEETYNMMVPDDPLPAGATVGMLLDFVEWHLLAGCSSGSCIMLMPHRAYDGRPV